MTSEAPPPANVVAATNWPRMRYGDLERLLVEQTGGEQRSVVARFRNMRQMPFPDAIRTGTGNRVEYDLPRVLALSTAFELGALLVPQSHAVAIVRDAWPELVRGFLAAAVALGVMQRPNNMPMGMSAHVAVLSDGFAAAEDPVATAANLGTDKGGTTDAGSHLRIDCSKMLSLIMFHLEDSAGRPDEAGLALADLDRTFGWSKGTVPHRGSAKDLFEGTSFLDRGPYLERAAAFLRIAVERPDEEASKVQRRGRSRQAAQNLLDYFANPSPIDHWKGEIGTEDRQPRLKHLLAAVGDAAQLETLEKWPDTFLATGGSTPAAEAEILIQRAAELERSMFAARQRTAPT